VGSVASSQQGWVKLNTGGASRAGVRTGCGGLIRGDKENTYVVSPNIWEDVVLM
jgi:hypothetical protein